MDAVGNLRLTVYAVIVALILFVLVSLPPLGVETRDASNLSPVWLALFGLVIAINIAAIPLLFQKPRAGIVLAMMIGVMNIVFYVADLFGLILSVSPPVAVFGVKSVLTIVSISILVLALRLSGQLRIAKPS